jgi:energy-coupling factor transporter ATP-binding protein EcfA2
LIGSSITSLIWLRIMEIGDIRVSRSPASRGRWGTLRKASIARALTLHPDILLLDEPLIELDQASRTSVVALLDELKGGGTTLVITTHYPDEVQQVVDYVYHLTPKPTRVSAVGRRVGRVCWSSTGRHSSSP